MNSKIFSAIAVLFAASAVVSAQTSPNDSLQNAPAQKKTNSVRMENGVDVRNARIERAQGGVKVSLDVDFRNVKVRSNRQVQVIPSLAGAEDTLMLARLSVVGRNRYFYYLRNKLEMKVSEYDQAWRKKDLPDTFHFSMTVPYEAWMNGARVMVNECVLGCCNKTLDDNWSDSLATFALPAVPKYAPVYVFRKPKAEVHKIRSLSATSYVDFPVSETVIYPNYRANKRELAKIVSTIDSVMQDKDVTISAITLCGFASPESPYENNVRLAKGRTAAIKQYVSKFNHVSPNIIEADYVPENWQGLREWVIAHNVPNAEGIIRIIDSKTLAPDPKEDYLKKTYPEEYAYLLKECYPGLRKVDYTIEYEVKHFVSVEEIMAAYKSDPGKLSKDEFFVLASSLSEEDPMHDAILKDAVTYYPTDPATNLNAANVAMKEGRMRDAGLCLEKAGDTFEAIYARGVYAALIGDYSRAVECLERVKAEIPEAQQALEQILTIQELQNFWK